MLEKEDPCTNQEKLKWTMSLAKTWFTSLERVVDMLVS